MNNDYSINDIINDTGKFNYAYVVMLVEKDIYASASIVFAESLRKQGCLGDLVIMVDNNIKTETIDMIKKFYNKIIQIDLIKVKNPDTVQSIILSKINAFNLEEYKKIFLIDVDTIIFTNIDKIFINSITPCISYLENKKNYGFVLIEPSRELFRNSINLINDFKSEFEFIKKPFEFIFDKLFVRQNKMNLNLSSNQYLDVDAIQYKDDKPFLMSSTFTIEQRMKLDTFKLWFSCFIEILNKYPEIKKVKTIQETIDVSKYFLAPMSRFVVKMIKSNKISQKNEQISHIYGKQKYNNIDYYHLDISKDYSGEYINYISNINGIKLFLQYLTIQTRINFYKFDKYKNAKELIKFFEMNEKVKNYNMYLHIFLNHYVRIFPNVFIVLEVNSIPIKSNKNNISDGTILSELKNNLLYMNKIIIEGEYLLEMLFNIFQNNTYSQRLEKLKSLEPKTEYSICYSIYETVGQIDIFDMIRLKSNIYILFDKGSKIRFGSIFFNQNSINNFKNLHRFCNYITYNKNNMVLDKKSLVNLIYFQTLKKWIYNNWSGNEIDNIIIGEIENNTNKLVLIDNITTHITKIKKINNNKIFFINTIFLKTSQYKNILKEKKTIIKSIYNPNDYWEIEGIKFLNKKIVCN